MQRIQWNHKRKAFELQGKLISGLLPSLTALLYPTYSWMEARDIQRRQMQHRPPPPPPPTTTQPSQQRSSSTCRGKEQGSKLDRQLHQCVLFAKDYNLSPGVFVNSKARRAAQRHMPSRAAQRLERMTAKLSLPSLNFFRMCHLKQLRPMYSQVTVGSVIARVATRVDVKCIDRNGDVVLIENKVGYSGFHHTGTAPMRAPFTAKSNCTYNQHQVQLAMTALLHRCQFPSQRISECFVWKYDDLGVSVFPLEAWAKEGAGAVHEMLRSTKFLQ